MCTSIALSSCPIKITINGKEICMQQDRNGKMIVGESRVPRT